MDKRNFLAMTAVSALLAASPVLAASDYYLKLGGVKGESTERAAASSIEVSSFSWGLSQGSSARAGSGAGAGKASMSDLSATAVVSPRDPASGQATGKRTHKPVAAPTTDGQASSSGADVADSSVKSVKVVIPGASSASTQALDRACATGEHIKSAELGGKGGRGERYQMTDVVVSSCDVTGNARHYELKGHVTLIK